MKLTAYEVGHDAGLDLEPAPLKREWMDATPDGFARRCLPLLIANQSGWVIRSRYAFTATWEGAEPASSLRVDYDEPDASRTATSHFGSGILTFHVPWLFRTTQGWNLLVRGPANAPKDGATALEGVVETDWAVATFTMNWKLTRPGLPVRFDAGEPVCMIVPQERGVLERFRCAVREPDAELSEQYRAWARSRSVFNGGPREAKDWQRDYMRGSSPGGASATEHQTQLRLNEFRRRACVECGKPEPFLVKT